MPLETMLIVRVKTDLNQELESLALRSGVSKSALVRNTLALCLVSRRKPNQMDAIMDKIRKEAEDGLFVRQGNGGDRNNGDQKQ
jgi:predicted transcriptional regulator